MDPGAAGKFRACSPWRYLRQAAVQRTQVHHRHLAISGQSVYQIILLFSVTVVCCFVKNLGVPQLSLTPCSVYGMDGC